MNTKQQHIEYHYKSGFASHENAAVLANAGLDLTGAAIPNFVFIPSREGQQFHTSVKKFIFGICDHYLGYLEYCERILLLSENIGKYGQLKLQNNFLSWLEPGGHFYNTKEDYDLLLKKREQYPDWKKNWKGLAEAVLEMQESHAPHILVYWENWFIERKAREELTLFRKAIGKTIHNV